MVAGIKSFLCLLLLYHHDQHYKQLRAIVQDKIHHTAHWQLFTVDRGTSSDNIWEVLLQVIKQDVVYYNKPLSNPDNNYCKWYQRAFYMSWTKRR